MRIGVHLVDSDFPDGQESAAPTLARGGSPAEARIREAPVEAVGAASSAITSADVRDFFEHRGYRTLDHPFLITVVVSILLNVVNCALARS